MVGATSSTGTVDAGPGVEVAARPDLAVVVPSVTGVESLTECLEALKANVAADLTLETLVIDRCGSTVCEVVRRKFPDVTLVSALPETTIPELRAMGFRRATADNVAVIEDHVLVRPGWARQMLSALAGGYDVVGGSVDNAATTRTIDWAAFLCEYSQLLPPLSARPMDTLAGNNVVYRRALLERYAGIIAEGRWEDHLHAAMRRDGVSVACRPEICVGHKMHYRVLEYLSQRYLYARSYAGFRASDMTLRRRALFAGGTLALPPVLLARIAARVFSKNRHRRELVRALPILAFFVCAWAAGEAVGYAAGPGRALARVR